MSLNQAKVAFTDAMKHLDPRQQPALYDFALGLERLCSALDQEFRDVKQEIQNIQSQLP